MRLSTSPNALATDARRLSQLYGDAEGLLPLWIAEPYLPLAPAITEAVNARAGLEWYGYEARPPALIESFWQWMETRNGWDNAGLETTISPSVGTSIAVIIDAFSEDGDGVILQPPVFTDFKPLIVRADRQPARNSLDLTNDGYRMNLDHLEELAADPSNKVMILCNPHNPIGRAWEQDELTAVARICAANDVFVIADEIHADLVLEPHRFTPFATAAAGTGARWVAIHGPIKTFGVAGLCDTLLISDDEEATGAFRAASSRLHLTRNNVVALAAFEAGYRDSAEWVDELKTLAATNVAVLRDGLPEPLGVVDMEATYLAWLDLRGLGLEVPELARWLADSARLALSPGHWFGREGAGFARMTIAAPTDVIEEATARLRQAVSLTGMQGS
ncbi:MAG: aminotransferase class I/II-fold pyridoxal phosphate-dependent enzyme [Acidimicrobiia bacterium]|nr:aminotransferase class I/II-fold pyridoxal phosphate-dependent enzyme [Acidimicrobiia bacterium]